MTAMSFEIATIMSVITGRFYATDFGDVHELIDHMTGESLMTHELVGASHPCEESLRQQYPDLSQVEPLESNDPEEIKAWVAGLEAKYGEERMVEQLPSGAYTRTDPLASLVAMMSAK